MDNVLARPEQIIPDWLTGVLREKGALLHGHVMEVKPDPGQTTFASTVWRLDVGYSPDVSPGAPDKLFLKVSRPALAPGEFDPGQLQQEITFYQAVAPAMEADIVIPCYHAAYESATGAGHILLKDVSATHATCLDPACRQNCERAVDALASLHAAWWDHPRLGQDIGQFPTAAEQQQDWIETERTTTAFITALGDQMQPAWRAAYERVLPALPGLFRRHAAGRNLTLVHGDAHLGNFLFPIDVGPTYIIDWQFWHPTIGGTDLAFLIATEWTADIRRESERALLRRYHAGLLARGVRDYPWETCWNDYRLSVILVSIFIPVWRWGVFHWKPDLEALARSMTAFAELNCDDLL